MSILKERKKTFITAVDISKNALKVAKVIIRVRKPHAPINAEFDTIEVELIRENEHFK